MVGALFWGLGDRNDYESILSRSAVLFYCVSFFIFMSVAVLPFTVLERSIVDKEVANKYYHPFSYQIAQGLASVPGITVLAFLTSLIIISMLKFKEPGWYFLNMFLALMTSEALAQLVSHTVPHFVIGMALIAGVYGFFMLFQGFMLVPSEFPNWLRWTNKVAFHTYSWRSFMAIEFRGEEFDDPTFPTGEDVLRFYEIEDTNVPQDVSAYLFFLRAQASLLDPNLMFACSFPRLHTYIVNSAFPDDCIGQLCNHITHIEFPRPTCTIQVVYRINIAIPFV